MPKGVLYFALFKRFLKFLYGLGDIRRRLMGEDSIILYIYSMRRPAAWEQVDTQDQTAGLTFYAPRSVFLRTIRKPKVPIRNGDTYGTTTNQQKAQRLMKMSQP